MSASRVFTGRHRRLWVALAAAGALAACNSQDPAQLVASGRSHLDKGDHRAAAIEFKNALQKDGSLSEARLLLGRTLMETGDNAGALVEFNKLQSAGYASDELATLHARTQ